MLRELVALALAMLLVQVVGVPHEAAIIITNTIITLASHRVSKLDKDK